MDEPAPEYLPASTCFGEIHNGRHRRDPEFKFRPNVCTAIQPEPLVPVVLITTDPKAEKIPPQHRVVLPPGQAWNRRCCAVLRVVVLTPATTAGHLSGFRYHRTLDEPYRMELFDKWTRRWKP